MSLVAEAICKDGSFGHPGVLKFCIFQPSPASKFIQGYLGAVISAVSIAVSSSHLLLCGCAPSTSGQTLSEGQGWASSVGGRGVCLGLSGREKWSIGREVMLL